MNNGKLNTLETKANREGKSIVDKPQKDSKVDLNLISNKYQQNDVNHLDSQEGAAISYSPLDDVDSQEMITKSAFKKDKKNRKIAPSCDSYLNAIH